MTPLYYILAYVFWINVVAYFLYAFDKHQAHYLKKRIPEALLIALAVLGGALGALMAMLLFRHKTSKPAFSITVPVLLALDAALMIALPVLIR